MLLAFHCTGAFPYSTVELKVNIPSGCNIFSFLLHWSLTPSTLSLSSSSPDKEYRNFISFMVQRSRSPIAISQHLLSVFSSTLGAQIIVKTLTKNELFCDGEVFFPCMPTPLALLTQQPPPLLSSILAMRVKRDISFI
jgi:hypothetical protein